MFGIGYQEMFIVLVVALVIFGPKRLPELAGQVDGFYHAAWHAIAVRSIAVDIGREVPDAGTEQGEVSHDRLSSGKGAVAGGAGWRLSRTAM